MLSNGQIARGGPAPDWREYVVRHLPARGRQVSRGGGGAGLPIGLGATGPGGGPRGGHECGAESCPWGGELQGGLKVWGGGVEEGTGVSFRPVGCPWRPDQREAVVEWRVEMNVGRGWSGRLPPFQGCWGHYGGGYRTGRAVPVAS